MSRREFEGFKKIAEDDLAHERMVRFVHSVTEGERSQGIYGISFLEAIDDLRMGGYIEAERNMRINDAPHTHDADILESVKVKKWKKSDSEAFDRMKKISRNTVAQLERAFHATPSFIAGHFEDFLKEAKA